MPGGLIQLLAWGAQNVKLNGNPSITFFKKVWKPHTNFSMESIRIDFNRSDANINTPTTLKAKLKRNGDLIQQMYFIFELPSLPSGYNWAYDIGEYLIDNYYVSIGGSIIDRQYGEFLKINSVLNMNHDEKETYDKMTKNLMSGVKITGSGIRVGRYVNNIKKNKFVIPLNFWFNKESSAALPLIALQYHDIEVTFELRPLQKCYIVQETSTDVRGPNLSNINETLEDILKTKISSIDIKAYLECNYYFVDTKEREIIAFTSHEFLIEQLQRVEVNGISKPLHVQELVLQNPVKELIWVLKDNFKYSKNNTENRELKHLFTSLVKDNENILNSAKITFNGMDRMEEKDYVYYELIQPYQHHKTSYNGVNVYSFSILPTQLLQPTGSCNMSRINKIQITLRLNENFFDYSKVNGIQQYLNIPSNLTYPELVELLKNENNMWEFDLTLYAISYNFLKITNGLAGLVFSN